MVLVLKIDSKQEKQTCLFIGWMGDLIRKAVIGWGRRSSSNDAHWSRLVCGRRVWSDLIGKRIWSDLIGERIWMDLIGQRVWIDLIGQRVWIDLIGREVVSRNQGHLSLFVFTLGVKVEKEKQQQQ